MWTRCKTYFLGLVLLTFSGGCSILPKFPEIAEVKSFRIEQNTDFMLKARVDASIYNPNVFSFTVKDMRYWAYVNFLELGGGEINGPVKFNAQDTSQLKDQPVYILYQNFNEILNKRHYLDSVPVTFFIIARMNISPIFPVYYIKTLWLKPADFLRAAINHHNIERLITIKNIDFKTIDLLKSKIQGQIILKNDFPLEYKIDSLCLDIYDRYEQKVGQIRICNEVVPQFTHKILPFEIYVDNILTAVSIMGQYIEEDIRYSARGNLYLTIRGEKFTIPVNQSIGLAIERVKN